MAFINQLSRRLRVLVRSERGMALPTALFATIASFGLASAAVVSSIDSQRGTTRDQYSKNAIAAADAGASVGMLRLNRFSSSLSSSNPCLGLSGNTLVVTTASGDGWCPAITGTVGGATYSYRVSPLASGTTMSIVSTGTVGTVSRRVDIGFKSTTVGSTLGAEGLIGQDSVTLNGNADIRVNVGTNGDVTGSGNASVCGNIRHGVGKQWTTSGNASQCNGYSVSSGNVTLPAVSTFMPSDITSNNSDYRLAFCTKSNPPVGCQSDTLGGGSWSSNSPWDPSTRSLSLAANSTLTLGGGDYWMCSLSLSGNSSLIMANTAHVRIFFDTPENCGTSSQINLSGNSTITATGYQPSLGSYDVPGFYLLGSTTKSSSVSLSGNNSTNELIVYGPNSDISISGNGSSTFKGAIAGKTITVSGNGATISQDSGFVPPQIGGATLYQRQSYVECVGASASPPNANC